MRVQRTFIPGSKWVYIKIYTGTKTADKILVNDIYYIVNKLRKNDIIQKWFFIRYSDPDFHLRIRFLAKEQVNIGEILLQCYKRLDSYAKGNLIWKIQVDTYNRELERYYDILIEEAESIFQIDSDCILSVLKKVKSDDHRWMIGIKLIDSFLNDFSLNIFEKQKLMNQLMNEFRKEFGYTEYNAKQLNVKFRENRKIIESVLNDNIDDSSFTSLYKIVRRKSKDLKLIVVEIKRKLEVDKKSEIISFLLGSYIHMTLNRLFRTKNRVYELLIYDFMYRFYTSEIARKQIQNI